MNVLIAPCAKHVASTPTWARRLARRLANGLFVRSLQEGDPLLRPPSRVAGHGAGEQQYRATEHEGIEQVVQAIVEAGAFHYRDRPVHD